MIVSGAESYRVDYTYDVNNRLLTSTKTQGNVREITRFAYDANGNEVSQLTHTVRPATGGAMSAGLGGDGWQLSSYNGLNQLVGVEKDGVTAVYTYRADGMRHSKEVNGERTQHVWDGANIVVDITGSSVVSYIRGIGLIGARNSGVWTYYLFNARGDVVQLANAGGTVTRTYRYDAFGVEQDPCEDDTNPWRFKGTWGYYWDNETGTYYMRFRHMNPVTGRFTQEDPIKDGLNWYTYVVNNPLMFSDPWGLFTWTERDNEWIAVNARTTQDAGGTFSETWTTGPNGSRSVTISIWGVEVTFRAGDAGVTTTFGFQVRADHFYRAIVASAGGEITFLGGHFAFGQQAFGLHTYLMMFIDSSSEHWDEGYFGNTVDSSNNPRINTRWGLQFATLGGGVQGVGLRSIGNRESDLRFDNKQLMQHISSGVGAICNLMSAHKYSTTRAGFAYNPLGGPIGFNSNSILSGLLRATELHPGDLNQTVRGWNNPISRGFFGR